MNKDLVIVKLGGSAITYKNKAFAPRKGVIETLAKEIKELLGEVSLVIVHGGGSFGHRVANQYSLDQGLRKSGQLIGVSKVRYRMTELSQMITGEMIKEGIPVFPLHPSSFVISSSCKIRLFFDKPVKAALEKGLVPLTFGDIILDKKKGISILSGDDLACRLAINLKALRLVYGTDVNGVYVNTPSGDKILAKKLRVSELSKVRFCSAGVDVTGGMRHKLKTASDAVKAGIKVLIGNITVPGVLSNMVLEKPDNYTVLIP